MADKTPKVADVVDDQFPSLAGRNDVEVAKRSQDVSASTSNSFKKVFVLTKRVWEGFDQASKDIQHENNVLATRNFLINQGLRPLDDGKFVGAEDHEDGASINLTYSVGVEAAAISDKFPVEHAFVHPEERI